MERRAIRIFYTEDLHKKWSYHYDLEKNKTLTFGDVKREFAVMNGYYEDRIRLLLKNNVIDDTSLVSAYSDDWDRCSNPSSSSGSDTEKDENDKDRDQTEKGELDESDKEKSKRLMKVFNEFHSKLSQQPNYEKGKLDRRGQRELREEIITVMRMQRSEPEPLEEEQRPEPVFVLDLTLEETLTLAIISANDDVKYLPFLERDTLAETRKRCANLFSRSQPDLLELRAREDSNIYNEGHLELSLGELGIEDRGSLFASCKGRHMIRTLFGLCACMDIDVNMEKTARSLRRKIVTIAPDLMNINFFMWYNGRFLSVEKNGPRLGDVIMGSSLLRVVIEMDLKLPYDTDEGPELRRRSDEEEARRRRDDKKDKPRNLSGSSSGKSDNSEEKSTKPPERLWFDVNKRALRNFDLLVECHKEMVTHTDNNGQEYEFDNGAEYEPPISLTKLTYRMLFYELRQKIAAACDEKSSHQILYRNGDLFRSEHDRKTLGELELIPDDEGIVKTIYKEPSITVLVEFKQEKIPMKVAGRGTSFGHLAKLMVEEKKVPLTLDKVAFKYGNIVVSKDVLFSECKVKNGDTIKLVETFKVRVWQDMYIYDKEFWPHSQVADFKKWIGDETDIAPKKQKFVKIADNSIIDLKDPATSLQEYGFEEIGEIEIFNEADLPERFQEKEKGDEAQGYVECPEGAALSASCESESDDEDDQ